MSAIPVGEQHVTPAARAARERDGGAPLDLWRPYDGAFRPVDMRPYDVVLWEREMVTDRDMR